MYFKIIVFFILIATSSILVAQTEQDLLLKLDTSKEKAKVLNDLSKLLLRKNNEKSLEYALKAIESSDLNLSENALANINAGRAYNSLNKHKQAIVFFKNAESIYLEHNISFGVASSKLLIARSYNSLQKVKKAIPYFEEAYAIFSENNEYLKASYAAHDLTEIYFLEDDISNTRKWKDKAIQKYKLLNNKKQQASVLHIYGAALGKYGDYENAKLELNNALTLANGHKELTNKIIETLDKIQYNENKDIVNKTKFKANTEDTIKKHIVSINRQNILSREEIKKLSFEKQVIELSKALDKEAYDKDLLAKQNLLDKQQKDLLLKDALLKYKESLILKEKVEKKHRTLQLYASLLFLFFISIITIVAYRNYIIKKKSYKDLSIKNKQIEYQKSEIEYKSKNIEKSIQYAQKIQAAIIPYEQSLSKISSSIFTIFKPKDQVSGDFIWSHTEKEITIIALADCTGHGVPGAFMSIICANLLEKVVIEGHILQPNMILEQVDLMLKQTLNKHNNTSSLNDGMDIALIQLNTKTNEIHYSGARNAIIIYSDNTLTTFKGDRRSIGYGLRDSNNSSFKLQKIRLKKRDRIYLFSDGIIDQRGGDDNQKFYTKRLKDFIVENKSEPLNYQKEILEDLIDDWKKSEEQMDDITLLGIEI